MSLSNEVVPSTKSVDVRLLRLPVETYKEAFSHHDALLREFSLLPYREHSLKSVSARFLEVRQEVLNRFPAFAKTVRTELTPLFERSDQRNVDVTLRIPAEPA